jgi:hypothetical protein
MKFKLVTILYFSQSYKSLDNLLYDHKLRVADINGLLTTITLLSIGRIGTLVKIIKVCEKIRL